MRIYVRIQAAIITIFGQITKFFYNEKNSEPKNHSPVLSLSLLF